MLNDCTLKGVDLFRHKPTMLWQTCESLRWLRDPSDGQQDVKIEHCLIVHSMNLSNHQIFLYPVSIPLKYRTEMRSSTNTLVDSLMLCFHPVLFSCVHSNSQRTQSNNILSLRNTHTHTHTFRNQSIPGNAKIVLLNMYIWGFIFVLLFTLKREEGLDNAQWIKVLAVHA